MYTYNRIHNDYDNNVVRVELNSYRPRAVKDPPMRVASSVSRNETFTKCERPSNIVRSETFILKHHHDESSDERPAHDYNTYTRSRKKSYEAVEKLHDDKSNYSTYTRPGKKGNECAECLRHLSRNGFSALDHF